MTNDLLTDAQKYERDVRLYGVQQAIDLAALRQRVAIHKELVSRESNRGQGLSADLSSPVTNADSRPQVGPSTIHGADKPLTQNLKDVANW